MLINVPAQEAMEKYTIEKVPCPTCADIGREVILTVDKEIAHHIKRTVGTPFALTDHESQLTLQQFDERKGATWHCIVGRNFGSFVTHGTEGSRTAK